MLINLVIAHLAFQRICCKKHLVLLNVIMIGTYINMNVFYVILHVLNVLIVPPIARAAPVHFIIKITRVYWNVIRVISRINRIFIIRYVVLVTILIVKLVTFLTTIAHHVSLTIYF